MTDDKIIATATAVTGTGFIVTYVDSETGEKVTREIPFEKIELVIKDDAK